MSDQPNSNRELRETWIESLLSSAAKAQDHSQRIAEAMSRIESADQSSTNAPSITRSRGILSRLLNWPTFGIAATVLLALFLTFRGGANQTAMAAIQRSLDVAAERLTRKYLLDIEYRPPSGKTLKVEAELYVKGNDRLAVRHPGLLPRSNFWFGRVGNESWVVPQFGPVLKGDASVMKRYIRAHEELQTPYLHVTTMLNQMMTKGFRLKTLADEEISIENGRSFLCRHVQAQASNPSDSNMPETIELWTSRESGMAVRLIARWNLADGETGRKSVVLTFQQEEPGLSDAWFTAEGHYSGKRPVLGPAAQNGMETP